MLRQELNKPMRVYKRRHKRHQSNAKSKKGDGDGEYTINDIIRNDEKLGWFGWFDVNTVTTKQGPHHFPDKKHMTSFTFIFGIRILPETVIVGMDRPSMRTHDGLRLSRCTCKARSRMRTWHTHIHAYTPMSYLTTKQGRRVCRVLAFRGLQAWVALALQCSSRLDLVWNSSINRVVMMAHCHDIHRWSTPHEVSSNQWHHEWAVLDTQAPAAYMLHQLSRLQHIRRQTPENVEDITPRYHRHEHLADTTIAPIDRWVHRLRHRSSALDCHQSHEQ